MVTVDRHNVTDDKIGAPGTYTAAVLRHLLALITGLVVTACSTSGLGDDRAEMPSDCVPRSVGTPPTATDAASGEQADDGMVAPSTVAFPMELSRDRRYLVDSTGTPFLLQGDAAWSLLVQLDVQEAEDYLDTRRNQGFNALVVNLVEHHYADDPPRNASGDEPFTTPGDFSTPNPAYFDHAARVIELAQERGFLMLLAPAYLGYDGDEEGWYQEMVDNGAEVLRGYGRYVGARYARFDNIIWLEGGDYTPSDDGLRLVEAVVEGIKERDPSRLHAAHWSPETSGLEVPVDWIDLDTVYTYDLVYQKSLEEYCRADDIPHILFESAYEDDIKDTTPQSLRAQAYYALLSGAVGQVYGHGDIWKFTENWREALDTPGSSGIVHLRQLFSTLRWHELVPSPDNRFLRSGQGSFGSDDYAVAAVAPEGDLAVVYLPGVRTIEVDLGGFGGPVRARFYDPTDGTYREAEGSPLRPSGTVALRPPGDNAMGDSDWVVVFDRLTR